MDTTGTWSDLHTVRSGADSAGRPEEREMNTDPRLKEATSLHGKQSSTPDTGTHVGAGKRGESAKSFRELGPKINRRAEALCKTHKSDSGEDSERM